MAAFKYDLLYPPLPPHTQLLIFFRNYGVFFPCPAIVWHDLTVEECLVVKGTYRLTQPYNQRVLPGVVFTTTESKWSGSAVTALNLLWQMFTARLPFPVLGLISVGNPFSMCMVISKSKSIGNSLQAKMASPDLTSFFQCFAVFDDFLDFYFQLF